jgi:hypothetical protein
MSEYTYINRGIYLDKYGESPGKVRDKLGGGKWRCCKAALLINKEPLINQGLFVCMLNEDVNQKLKRSKQFSAPIIIAQIIIPILFSSKSAGFPED